MMHLVLVGIGGFFGAIARHLLSLAVLRWYGPSFPAGTLLVNLLGCWFIGGLMTLVQEHHLVSPAWRLFLITGILGSLTTFSTFGFETLDLLRSGRLVAGLLNAALNLGLGLLAVFLGISCTRRWLLGSWL